MRPLSSLVSALLASQLAVLLMPWSAVGQEIQVTGKIVSLGLYPQVVTAACAGCQVDAPVTISIRLSVPHCKEKDYRGTCQLLDGSTVFPVKDGLGNSAVLSAGGRSWTVDRGGISVRPAHEFRNLQLLVSQQMALPTPDEPTRDLISLQAFLPLPAGASESLFEERVFQVSRALAVASPSPTRGSTGQVDIDMCRAGSSPPCSGTFHFTVEGVTIGGAADPLPAFPACPVFKTMQEESAALLELANTLETDDQAYEDAVVDMLVGGYDSDFARLAIDRIRDEQITELFKDDAATQTARAGVVAKIREKASIRGAIAGSGLAREGVTSVIASDLAKWGSPAVLDYMCSPDPASMTLEIWQALWAAGYVDFETFEHVGYDLFAREADQVVLAASTAAAVVPFARVAVTVAGRTFLLRAAQAASVRSLLRSALPVSRPRALGKVYRTLSAAEANAPFAAAGFQSPYAAGSRVRDVSVSSERRFLRFDASPTQQAGRWLVKSSDVEGLTASQIRDKLALPQLPTHVSDVIVPAGARLRIGQAAPQPGWGAGGGVQVRVESVGGAQMQFLNRRPIQ